MALFSKDIRTLDDLSPHRPEDICRAVQQIENPLAVARQDTPDPGSLGPDARRRMLP